VINAGVIAGDTASFGLGVATNGTGGVTNQSGGSISGMIGVYGYRPAIKKLHTLDAPPPGQTVVNAGAISGAGGYAVKLAPGYVNRVIVDPGGSFSGTVSGGDTTTSTLELAPGTSAGVVGTLSGLGTQFVNFAQIAVDSGASWSLTGGNSVASGITLTDSGALTIGVAGALTDASALTVAAGGSVTNAGVVSGAVHGVRLVAGGGVANRITGTIAGANDGIYLTGVAGTVTNAGTIAGATWNGVVLIGGGVSNQITGTISGGNDAISITTSPGIVDNAGAILGGATADGVQMFAGGGVTNRSTGTISGGFDAVYNAASAGRVTNAGLISGAGRYGILFLGSGNVTNQGGGMIAGASVGIVSDRGLTLSNAGTVSGFSQYGARLVLGGSIVNQSPGSISGGHVGIFASSGAATVTNAGIISGATAAVALAAGFANRVIVDPGAVFSGTVNGGNTIGGASYSVLELAPGATSGLISGLGVQFIDFARTTIDAGALWTLTGANSLAAGTTLTNGGALTLFDGGLSDAGSVIDNGLIQVDAATLTVGTLSGSGEVLISGGTLTVSGGVAAGATVGFTGTGLLALAPSEFSGQIDGLGGGGRIELSGITDATSAGIVNGNTLAIQQSAGPTLDLTLDPAQSYAGIVFPIATLGGVQFVAASEQVGPTVIEQGETESVTGAVGSTLAAIAGGEGGIVVTGANSLLRTTADALIVGDAGTGSLSIESAGTANAAIGLTIANTAAASGSSVDVSGAGSDLAVTGTLIVGDAGSGALSLSQGATVTAAALDLGAAATGDGNVSLAGAGTTLDVTGNLTLGDKAAGELSILGGAQMTIGGGVVGSGKSAPGNLDVEGAGTTLTVNTGTLTVGANGPAEFTLGIGAVLKGEVANGPFGVVSEYGNVDPATDPNDGTQNVGFGNSLIYDYYIANSGTIKITSGTASFFAPLVTDETNAADGSTSGLWVIGAHETLVMNTTSVDNTQTFDLTSPSAATLVIGQIPQASTTETDTFNGQTMPALTGSVAPGSPNVLPGWDAPIENFQSGDLIVLRGLTYGSATAAGDVVTVWSQSGGLGSALGRLTFLTKSGSASPTEAAAAAAQINSLATLPCFAAGTRIATLDGWVNVEDLRVGDRMRLVSERSDRPDIDSETSGHARAATAAAPREAIVWVGSRAVNCAKHPRPETVRPVRVSAGAFGEHVPERDLYLSPDHAVFVNRVLIPVKLLINGGSITQVKRSQVTYYHVELPEHAVILAEGLPVESYLDTGDRANFAGPETIRLYPDFGARLAPNATMPWETKAAAPLVLAGKQLVAARAAVQGTSRASKGARPRGVPKGRAKGACQRGVPKGRAKGA
jgi:T5SS/PEP-CTERM-associated repeat protein